MRRWKLDTMCDNCPFAMDGPGLALRQSLAKGRWYAILSGLFHGQHFLCHKTTIGKEEGDEDSENVTYPKGMICAGARAWQAERGIVSDAEQIMSRLEQIRNRA